MHGSKEGTTLVEVMVVMLIIIIGIIGVYNIYQKSRELSYSTQHRIIATQIAREGLEGVVNIRDTNWKIFGVNTQNCWMVQDYNQNCITSNTLGTLTGSYVLYTDGHNRWRLKRITTPPPDFFTNATYKSTYAVNIDSKGFYTQSGGTITSNPFFTREIRFLDASSSTPSQYYRVESIVRWGDAARYQGNYEVILATKIANWQK